MRTGLGEAALTAQTDDRSASRPDVEAVDGQVVTEPPTEPPPPPMPPQAPSDVPPAPARPKSWGRRLTSYWLVAAVLIAAGSAVRLVAWWHACSLWGDELYVLYNVRVRGFLGLARPLDLNQAAPLGWLWLEKLAGGATGYTEHGSRFVPLVFGCATLVVVAYLARRVLSGPAALVVVVMVAASPLLIGLSNGAKQYTSEAFWVTAIVAAGLCLVFRRRSAAVPPEGAAPAGSGTADDGTVDAGPGGYEPGRREIAIFWAVAVGGAALSHTAMPVGAAVVVLVALHLVIRRLWRVALRFALGLPVWLAVLAGLASILLSADRNDELQRFWATSYPSEPLGDLPATWDWLYGRITAFVTGPMDLPYPLLIIALMLVGLIRLAVRRGVIVAAMVFSPLVVGLAASAVQAYPFRDRLALFAVPCSLVLVGAAVDRFRLSWLGGRAVAILAITLAIPIALVFPQLDKAVASVRQPDEGLRYRQAVRYIAAHRQPGDLVMTNAPTGELAIRWYGVPRGLHADIYFHDAKRTASCTADQQLARVAEGHHVLWLLGADVSVAPLGVVINYLRRMGHETVLIRHSGYDGRVYRYDLDAPADWKPVPTGLPAPRCPVISTTPTLK